MTCPTASALGVSQPVSHMTSDRVTRLSESQPARLGAIRNPAGPAGRTSSQAGGSLAPHPTLRAAVVALRAAKKVAA